jgi:hypothetical protein
MYLWNNGDTVQNPAGLSAGNYSVTVTDANGCVANSYDTLFEPDPVTVIPVESVVNGGYNISCYGMSDGSIDLMVSGGTQPYSYQWNNGPACRKLFCYCNGC